MPLCASCSAWSSCSVFSIAAIFFWAAGSPAASAAAASASSLSTADRGKERHQTSGPFQRIGSRYGIQRGRRLLWGRLGKEIVDHKSEFKNVMISNRPVSGRACHGPSRCMTRFDQRRSKRSAELSYPQLEGSAARCRRCEARNSKSLQSTETRSKYTYTQDTQRLNY